MFACEPDGGRQPDKDDLHVKCVLGLGKTIEFTEMNFLQRFASTEKPKTKAFLRKQFNLWNTLTYLTALVEIQSTQTKAQI